ncbi:MAG: GTPase [Chloroflexota bacterium]
MSDDQEEKENKPANLDEWLKEFPEGSRQVLRATWEALSPAMRQQVLSFAPALPGDVGKLRQLAAQSRTHLEMALGEKHKVVIVGPANVGKSTLYNQLIAAKDDRAKVSPVPGTTRANQSAATGLFTIVDTPGADAVGEVGVGERKLALQAAASADFLIILFDAVQGIKRTEQELFHELQTFHKPYVVALNKMDLAGRANEQHVLEQAAVNLGLAAEQVIPLVAEDGKNLETIVMAIVKAEPALLTALGQALPAYRWRLAWRVITGAASTAALIALTPLPLIDFIPLITLQTTLVLGIARIYEYRLTPARAKELAGTFGLGLLARTLFQELSKLGGPPGWLLSSAVAASTTVVMGYAAIVWFEKGERLTNETVERLSRTMTDYLLETLKGLGQRRPSRQRLSEKMMEALEKSPIAQGPVKREE